MSFHCFGLVDQLISVYLKHSPVLALKSTSQKTPLTLGKLGQLAIYHGLKLGQPVININNESNKFYSTE